MLGIIKSDLGVYSLIDKIRNTFPNINIYISKDEDKALEIMPLFIERKCQIIIADSSIKSELVKLYPDIYIVSLEDVSLDNMFIFQNNLVEAVCNGSIDKVKEILEEEYIAEDKIIVLDDLRLLFIESYIREYFSNRIISSIDLLLEELKRIVVANNINIDGDGVLQELFFK